MSGAGGPCAGLRTAGSGRGLCALGRETLGRPSPLHRAQAEAPRSEAPPARHPTAPLVSPRRERRGAWSPSSGSG